MKQPAHWELMRLEEIPVLLELMREFYVLEHLHYDETIARSALSNLLSDPQIGRVLLLKVDEFCAGYIVLTFGFSLEFRGRDALVDEFYIREAYRGQGLGQSGLSQIEKICQSERLAAIHLEVDHQNVRAQEIYRRSGYQDHNRFLLTKWIRSSPS